MNSTALKLGFTDYFGRIVYNFSNEEQKENADTYKINNKNYTINNKINVFRTKEDSFAAEVTRMFQPEALNIQEAIRLKKITDTSLMSEINYIGETKVCNSTYSSCFKFKCFTSNIETHFFSKKGCHQAKVESLGAYSAINYSCWDNVNNTKMQNILIGQQSAANTEESMALSQTVSLFLCESSRNPSSFLTAPMCLEISEYLYQNQNFQLKEKIKTSSKMKSEIIKDTILNYFPMAMSKAVAASRYISDEINAKIENDKHLLGHKYDKQEGSVRDAKTFLNTEIKLIDKWIDIKKQQSSTENKDIKNYYYELLSSWYNINDTDINSIVEKTNDSDIIKKIEVIGDALGEILNY